MSTIMNKLNERQHNTIMPRALKDRIENCSLMLFGKEPAHQTTFSLFAFDLVCELVEDGLPGTSESIDEQDPKRFRDCITSSVKALC